MKFDLDLVSFWQQGDVISHIVLFLLLGMSITSWAIIISKSVQLAWWQYASSHALEQFWQAKNIAVGEEALVRMAPFRLLVERGNKAVAHYQDHQQGAQGHLDAQ